MDFYRKFLLAPATEKMQWRQKYGFSGAMTVSPGDWELFAAILLRQQRSTNPYGHDLECAEVKSAGLGSSFEYQYHRNGGAEKLAAETTIDHLFIQHSDQMRNLVVHVVSGSKLATIFGGWQAGLQINYEKGRQRYRKNVPASFVKTHGTRVLEIKDGVLVYASDELLSNLMVNWRRA